MDWRSDPPIRQSLSLDAGCRRWTHSKFSQPSCLARSVASIPVEQGRLHLRPHEFSPGWCCRVANQLSLDHSSSPGPQGWADLTETNSHIDHLVGAMVGSKVQRIQAGGSGRGQAQGLQGPATRTASEA